MLPEYFVGLMSGTSIDSIDAVITKFEQNEIKVIASGNFPIPLNIHQEILSLCAPGENEINRMGILDNQLGALFAEACNQLLSDTQMNAEQIAAIGSHGQTIRHMPNSSHPFTLQIGNPALIAELTNITTIADFRRADIAAGGQGAPLVPAFHQAIFSNPKTNRVIVNIGGMANITVLNGDNPIGFDTGPGNVLLNAWIVKNKNHSYDHNGEWSASHIVDMDLLTQMIGDSYFHAAPPKSTGREYFNLTWLEENIKKTDKAISAGDIQSTLCELSALSICNAINESASNIDEIIVCGGGVHNQDLLKRIKSISSKKVLSTMQLGIDPDYVEATAFAWLARQALHNIPANMPSVTGASHHKVLGAIYPR